jgi:DNA-binding IclR family transcriptional regulator
LTPEQAGNRTVLVGIEILQTVVRSKKAIALTDIAKQTAMSPSRTHRYIASLCKSGFLRQDPETGRYDVGPGAIELGISAMARIDGIRLAANVMEELTGKTRLVSYLCVWGSNGPTVIKNELGSVQTAVRVLEGTNLSMLTATCQIFLTYWPRAETIELFNRDLAEWNASAPTGRQMKAEDIEKVCKKVRVSQIARTTGMRNPTWTAFSAPVFGPGGKFMMALTLIGVSNLFDTRINGEVAGQLKSAAMRLSSSLGAPGA